MGPFWVRTLVLKSGLGPKSILFKKTDFPPCLLSDHLSSQMQRCSRVLAASLEKQARFGSLFETIKLSSARLAKKESRIHH